MYTFAFNVYYKVRITILKVRKGMLTKSIIRCAKESACNRRKI